jgi:hypothetical protein
MNALFLTLFVSAGLVLLALLGFAASVVRKDHEHNDRLAGLPLEDDHETEHPASSAQPSLPTC